MLYGFIAVLVTLFSYFVDIDSRLSDIVANYSGVSTVNAQSLSSK